MASLTFSPTNAACTFGGTWLFLATGFGRPCWQVTGDGSDIEFTATGTDLTLTIRCGVDNAWEIVIDGGAPSTVTITGGSFVTITAFTGLSDTAHTVILRMKQGVTGGKQIDSVNFGVLTGATPAVSLMTGFGTTYLVASNTAFAGDGAFANVSNGNYTTPGNLQVTGRSVPDGGIRFKGTLTGLKVWTNKSSGIGAYPIREAADQANGTLTTTGGAPVLWQWLDIASGLDGTAEHEYFLSVAATALFMPIQVMAVGGTINAAAVTNYTPYAFYGDSITLGAVGTSGDSSLSFVHLVGMAARHGVVNLGFNNSRVVYLGSNADAGEHRTAEVTGLATAPPVVVILYGANDAGGVGAAYNAATYLASYTAMLNSIIAGLPTAKIYCFGMLPTSASGTYATNRASVCTQTAAAVAAVANSNVTFWSTDGVIDPDNGVDTIADKLHPSPTGYVKITNYVIRVLNGSGIFPYYTSAGMTGRMLSMAGGMQAL